MFFTIALCSILVFNKSKSWFEKIERQQSLGEPTRLSGVTEDPTLAFNWGLERIHAQEAWTQPRIKNDIVIAIIDTGVDIHHPDLQSRIWRNSGELGLDEDGLSRATNGKDDDDNGFVDDVYGWNFVNDSPEIMDDHGHGTHIAGIIAAERGYANAMVGVAPNVSLMILKYYDSHNSGTENLNYTVRAIRYAIRMGANIINYSGGGILRNAEEENMLRWAAEAGVLVVAAAGNEGTNSDFFHFYPANYKLPNIISVTATDKNGDLLKGSNFGKATVHLGAPGKNIYSTLPGGNYGYMSGTSQATAFVSGVAALLIGAYPSLNRPEKIIAKLLEGGKHSPGLYGKSRSGKELDAQGALANSSTKLAERVRAYDREPTREENKL